MGRKKPSDTEQRHASGLPPTSRTGRRNIDKSEKWISFISGTALEIRHPRSGEAIQRRVPDDGSHVSCSGPTLEIPRINDSTHEKVRKVRLRPLRSRFIQVPLTLLGTRENTCHVQHQVCVHMHRMRRWEGHASNISFRLLRSLT